MRVDDFDFDPPHTLTAPRPVSRATPLVCCSFPPSWRFEDRQIADLPASMRTGDLLLLFNDAKAIPARLDGRRMLLDILCRDVGK
jgi:S-adenosylmethionine:tRNA-ribosyltransferase-isomerase (queuine synthetase)